MLFHEIYGTYYAVIADILWEAVRGTLTRADILRITSRSGFGESILTIPDALDSGTWPLLDRQLRTPLRHEPTMPVTDLELRWLKTILSDPRVRLFSPSEEGLEDVRPLYQPSDLIYFDRFLDADPFEDPAYIRHFRTILGALRAKKILHIRYAGKQREIEGHYLPLFLEYSEKDDKFRVHVKRTHRIEGERRQQLTLNLASILSCSPADSQPEHSCCASSQTEAARQPAGRSHGTADTPADPPIGPNRYNKVDVPATEYPSSSGKRSVTLELYDQRNALERAMLHFSDLEKETIRLQDDLYRVRLMYQADDETEILIRILSFGPMIRVLSPENFVKKMRERMQKQAALLSSH